MLRRASSFARGCVRSKISYRSLLCEKKKSSSCPTSKSGHSLIPPPSPFVPTDDGKVGGSGDRRAKHNA